MTGAILLQYKIIIIYKIIKYYEIHNNTYILKLGVSSSKIKKKLEEMTVCLNYLKIKITIFMSQ